MKYLIFAHTQYYPGGGIADLIGTSNGIKDAVEILNSTFEGGLGEYECKFNSLTLMAIGSHSTGSKYIHWEFPCDEYRKLKERIKAIDLKNEWSDLEIEPEYGNDLVTCGSCQGKGVER